MSNTTMESVKLQRTQEQRCLWHSIAEAWSKESSGVQFVVPPDGEPTCPYCGHRGSFGVTLREYGDIEIVDGSIRRLLKSPECVVVYIECSGCGAELYDE